MTQKKSTTGKSDHTGFMKTERALTVGNFGTPIPTPKNKKKKKKRKDKKNPASFVSTCSYE